MRPRFTCILAIAAVSLLSTIAIDHGVAKVVRDSNAVASNPSVEAGGPRPPKRPDPSIPYSLVGAIASEGYWMMQCAIWPWQQSEPLAWFRHRWLRGDAPRTSLFPSRHPAQFVPMRLGDGHH